MADVQAFHYRLLGTDGLARHGAVVTPRGVIRTPAFMPVGTVATVKALYPEQVAEAVVQGLAEERFLILPHPEVQEYFTRKATDYDRWLRGMRRLQTKIVDSNKPISDQTN